MEFNYKTLLEVTFRGHIVHRRISEMYNLDISTLDKEKWGEISIRINKDRILTVESKMIQHEMWWSGSDEHLKVGPPVENYHMVEVRFTPEYPAGPSFLTILTINEKETNELVEALS